MRVFGKNPYLLQPGTEHWLLFQMETQLTRNLGIPFFQRENCCVDGVLKLHIFSVSAEVETIRLHYLKCQRKRYFSLVFVTFYDLQWETSRFRLNQLIGLNQLEAYQHDILRAAPDKTARYAPKLMEQKQGRKVINDVALYDLSYGASQHIIS